MSRMFEASSAWQINLESFCQTSAQKTKSLHDLLKKENQWNWGEEQKKAFLDIKADLSSTDYLAHYSKGGCSIVLV